MADIMNDNNENAEYHYNYQSNILTGIIYYCSIFPEISQQNRTFLIMVVMQNEIQHLCYMNLNLMYRCMILII